MSLTLLKSSFIVADSLSVARGSRARCLYLAIMKSCLFGLEEREREREREMMRYKIHYNTYKEREVGEEERSSYCNLSLGDGFFSFTLDDES